MIQTQDYLSPDFYCYEVWNHSEQKKILLLVEGGNSKTYGWQLCCVGKSVKLQSQVSYTDTHLRMNWCRNYFTIKKWYMFKMVFITRRTHLRDVFTMNPWIYPIHIVLSCNSRNQNYSLHRKVHQLGCGKFYDHSIHIQRNINLNSSETAYHEGETYGDTCMNHKLVWYIVDINAIESYPVEIHKRHFRLSSHISDYRYKNDPK